MPPRFALFELGFRPFFALAGVFSVLAMVLWVFAYTFAHPLTFNGVPAMTWHAHEMIYGYALAVVAGFLLTAVVNWTGVATITGGRLAALAALWLIARLGYVVPFEHALALSALADLLFLLGLIVAVSIPVVRVRQWGQFGVVSKLWLMLLAHVCFFAGVFGYLDRGMHWGLYGGLYVILGLVFVMARRVLPFFIERGVDGGFAAKNRRWVDNASLVLFLIWAGLDLFATERLLLAWVSIALLMLHCLRLFDWHTPGIWQRPLLWSLYLGYAFLACGFLLKAVSIWSGLSPFLSLHAFAVGGIGLMTLGMMARVTLGHTGRNVFQPPGAVTWIFALMVGCALTRVALPALDPGRYLVWMAGSQVLWVLAFVAFCLVYLPQLARPRVDGRPG